MHARYDDERINLTPGFVAALQTLMREQMAMMAARDPAYADCWVWGECVVRDVSSSRGLEFTFGSDEDRSEGMINDVRVVCA